MAVVELEHRWVGTRDPHAAKYECTRCGVTSNEVHGGSCVVDASRQHDPVSHPSHYTSSPGNVECIVVAEWMSFNIGNAVKYLWRCGLKEGEDPLTALRKAKWYIDREIGRLEKAKTP
jgi:hypothetical protein